MNKAKSPQQKPKQSKKKLILIGTVFVVCALLLKKDAH